MRLRLACTLTLAFALAGCPGPSTENDAGSTPNDAFVDPNDTGVPGSDAFVPPTDAGMLGNDAFVPPTDAGTMVDAFVAMTDSGADAGGTTGCGSARPTLPMAGTEGLVIARDGTIYFSRNGGVSRLASDGTLTTNWLTIPGAGQIWGLALDATNTHLYVCNVGPNQVVDVTNLTTTPTQTMLATVASPNGITVGPDGAVYVSSFADDSVMRIDPTTGTTTTVTASSIAQADGVAFTDDGHLLVTSYMLGRVYSLTLDGSHHETARATVATTVPAADGVAIDEHGVIYVGGGRTVWRIGPGGTPDMTLQMMGPNGTANLEWGAGALNCQDLYVATGSGLRRIPLTVGQRAVPWH